MENNIRGIMADRYISEANLGGKEYSNMEHCPAAITQFKKDFKQHGDDNSKVHAAAKAVDDYLSVEDRVKEKGSATEQDLDQIKAGVEKAKSVISDAGLTGHTYHQGHIDFVKDKIKDVNEEMINETGHDDVISMKTKTVKAMKAIQTMAKELDKLKDEDPLPTWWTNKVAMAVSNLDNMADYLDAKVPDGEVEEQNDKPPFTPDKKPTKKDQFGNPIKTQNVAKHLAKKAMKKTMGEEAELTEANKAAAELKDYANKRGGMDKNDFHTAAKHIETGNQSALKKHLQDMDTSPREKVLSVMNKHGHDIGKMGYKMRREEAELDEKTLTPAEKKKREDVAKAIERDNPDMPMDKKMAIATATAKKVAEEKKSFVRSMIESKLKRKS